MKICLIAILFLSGLVSLAQVDTVSASKDSIPDDGYIHFFYKADPLVEQQNAEIDKKEFKEKKPFLAFLRGKSFYGYKVKRGYAKHGYGRRETVETFYYLKEYKQPDEYVPEVYWYNTQRRKIIESRRIDEEKALILHGPYEKTIGGELVEKGSFYVGTKHNRWVKYRRQRMETFKDTIEIPEKTLLEKITYDKGWPESFEMSYYDAKREQIKEIKPYDVDGVLDGFYYAFYRDGKIKERGRYEINKKVGEWTEYFDGTRTYRKRVLDFGEGLKDESDAVLLKEWDKTGHVIYDKQEEDRKAGR